MTAALESAIATFARLRNSPQLFLAISVCAPGFVLLGKTVEQLSALAVHFGQPAYRGAQLRDAMLKGAHSLDDINNVGSEQSPRQRWGISSRAVCRW